MFDLVFSDPWDTSLLERRRYLQLKETIRNPKAK